MDVYLVDWDAFQEEVFHSDASEVLDGLEPVQLADENKRAPLAFMEAFDAFKRAWKSDEKFYFKEVFDTLFWDWRGDAYRIMELRESGEEDCDLDCIETALKPETVRALLQTAKRLDLQACRHLYEEFVDDSNRFGSFDRWREYGEEWLGLLRRADVENRGLIVAGFG